MITGQVSTSSLTVAAPPDGSRYSLSVTRDAAEVREAQRLRYRVLADEMGAVLDTPEPGLDVDRFDAFCDHLVVRDGRTGDIVGTYRVLAPDAAQRAGGLYAETEFDLGGLAGLRGELVETGRACVHPDHRSGAVMNLMWAGLGRYLLLTGNRWLVGCASVPITTPDLSDGELVAGVWDKVEPRHLCPAGYRVRPHVPWALAGVPRPERAVLPPLLRGYLRLGAWVCGPPAHDPAFGVADFLVLLGLDHVESRYLWHFLGTGA